MHCGPRAAWVESCRPGTNKQYLSVLVVILRTTVIIMNGLQSHYSCCPRFHVRRRLGPETKKSVTLVRFRYGPEKVEDTTAQASAKFDRFG